jgi:uncharacterized protein
MTQEMNPIATGTMESAQPEAIAAAPELTPVAETQRIDVLDVLRGFALIGILLMNIEWFNRAIAVLTAPDLLARDFDHGAGFLVKILIEGKFYKLFSLLFGMGFAVMLLRAEEAKRPFFAWFARRAGVLLLIGLAHSVFLWTGDILHDYAIGAFLLLGIVWLRTRPRFAFLRDPQWLLRISIGMLLAPILIMSAYGIGMMLRSDPVDLQQRHALSETKRAERIRAWPQREAELLSEARKVAPGAVGERPDREDEKDEKKGADTEARAEADNPVSEHWFKRKEHRTKAIFWEQQAMTSPDYWVATKYRALITLEGLAGAPFFAFFLLLPIFMLGWWLVETGKIRHPEQHLILFRTMAWVGWPFGLVFSMAAGTLMYHPAWSDGRGPESVTSALHWCGQILLCAAYVASFVLLLRMRCAKRWVGWLAPLGRMALTNYLMHSLVFSTLFYGYGAGWFGQVPRFQQMGLVVGMILFQAIFSRLWLANFNYGPMEWLWRSATYLKWQPLRRNANAQGMP